MNRAEYQRRWRKENRDKVRGYEKAYEAKPGNKAKRAALQKAWRQANPDRAKEIDAKKYENGKERNRRSKMLAGARDRAKLCEVPFDLTIEDIVIPKVCPVLGIEIKSGSHRTRPELDRRVPALGYVRGNVCVISGRANRLKSDATKEELAALLAYLS